MPNLLLNDRVVEGIKKPGMYWDASIRAFGVRVGKNTKTFIIVKDGGHRISLGRYPATSLREARRAALNHQGDAQDIAASQTLKDARQTYMTTYVEPNYKAYHYIKDGHYKDDAKSALCLFLCTTIGRKNALMAYTKERFGSTTFFGFATTSDWVREGKYPPPSPPLVPEWERVGYPPLKLENFIKGGA